MSRSERATPYLFLAPAALALALVFGYPILYAVYTGLFSYDYRRVAFSFAGLSNYWKLLGGGEFWGSLVKTIVWTAGSVALQLGGGLVLALALNRRFRGNRAARALILVPWVTPGVVIGLNWRTILHEQYGLANRILGGLGLEGVRWLSLPSMAMFSVVLANAWKGIPFATVMLLATLASVPREQYEAARIDGADALRCFAHVTWPHLKPVFVFLAVLMTMWTVNFFDLIFVMTAGGPYRATEILPILVYRHAFLEDRFGLAAALAVLIALLNAAFGVAYFQTLKGRT